MSRILSAGLCTGALKRLSKPKLRVRLGKHCAAGFVHQHDSSRTNTGDIGLITPLKRGVISFLNKSGGINEKWELTVGINISLGELSFHEQIVRHDKL